MEIIATAGASVKDDSLEALVKQGLNIDVTTSVLIWENMIRQKLHGCV